MIWIIGGTSEAVQLVHRINDRKDYVVTVATCAGTEALNGGNVIVARLTKQQMIDFICQRKIDMVIDMSHPYAVEVTDNARRACQECQVRYIRYVRQKTRECTWKGVVYFRNMSDVLAYLKTVRGCVFFTTGIKNISDFEKIRGSNRFVYRVLPSSFSMAECVKNRVKMQDIVAILGPVSKELNRTMFQEYKADYVVMKDSGKEGGTVDKLAACNELGITPIVIGRNNEKGIHSMDELIEIIQTEVSET